MPQLQYETRNKTVEEGDYIVSNGTHVNEIYIVKPEVFKKNYNPKPIFTQEDGRWSVYTNNEDLIRNRLIAEGEMIPLLKTIFQAGNLPQDDFLMLLSPLKTQKCRKKAKVWARIHKGPKKVIETWTVPSDRPLLGWFFAAWGDLIRLHEGDSLIINSTEIYRVGASEFQQTYEVL
tara:strand:- start:327 stop:854 length:528 start_codon:yes stop_codon:yes gene_type:complete